MRDWWIRGLYFVLQELEVRFFIPYMWIFGMYDVVIHNHGGVA